MNHKIYTLLFAMAALNMTITGMDMMNVDLKKTVATIRTFSLALPGMAAPQIETVLVEKLKKLPDNILNIDISNLQAGKLSAALADRLNEALPKAVELIHHIRPFIDEPATGLVVFGIASSLAQSKIPESIRSTNDSGVTLAQKIMASNDPADKAGIAAIQAIFNAAAHSIEKLNASKISPNGLLNYDLLNDYAAFKSVVENNIQALHNFIIHNHAGLKTLFQQAQNIQLNDLKDLSNLGNVAKEAVGMFGITL